MPLRSDLSCIRHAQPVAQSQADHRCIRYGRRAHVRRWSCRHAAVLAKAVATGMQVTFEVMVVPSLQRSRSRLEAVLSQLALLSDCLENMPFGAD